MNQRIYILRRFCITLFGFLVFSSLVEGQDYQQKLDQLDQYIEVARKQWEVPGLAVAIVKDGQPVWCKGYGVRKVGAPEMVDRQTLFAICSTTKAMTAACMSMLVDEGKIDWDDKVCEVLPDFRLSDPFRTQEIRVRDLFTHNTGLGNADLLWYMWDYDPDVIMSKMQTQEPAYPLRGGFVYQNNMYAVAGKVIEKVSGKTWDEFIQERIFNPLEMDNTFPNQKLSLGYANRSIAHTKYQNNITAFADESADKIAPAGAVWSTVEDMQKWVIFVLDSAKVDGKRLISDENYREWLKPQSIISDSQFYPTQRLTKPHWKTYALGWFQHDYQGRAVNFHTGSLQGTIAIVGLVPDERLGVYVFGNLDHAEVRHAIMYKVFDVFSEENEGRDWSSDLLDLYESLKPKPALEEEQIAQILPSYKNEEFAGIYEDDYLGKIEIVQEEGELRLMIGPKDLARLTHKNRNTFRLEFISRPYIPSSTIIFEDNGTRVTGLKYYNRQFKKIQF